eukprot:TRINITY_DN7517_c0_g1_i1.p1 TRINITY_DN7517_c0_g1~~TRINITY_DN7517_c0_g1_i1.p1  ORF type:complete len:417 (+),score=57.87 TRINITY_DN7517_c0_g1_i1:128-1378(+)
MVFVYDASELSIIATACRLSHTVAPHVLSSSGFWIFLALNLSLWIFWKLRVYEKFDVLSEYADEDGVFYVSHTCLATINNMTVFFEVFYTNQCYQRYFLLSKQVNNLFQASHRFSFSVKALLDSRRDYFALVMRFSRVSLILFLAFVKHGEAVNNELFEEMLALQLVTPEEHEILSGYTGPQKQLVLLDWMMRGTQAGHQKVSALLPAKAPNMLRDAFLHLGGLDAAQKEVLQTIRMPVPFQYFQLLNLMVSINICSWAYGMSRTESIFGPLVYACVSFIFLGMMVLANMFAHPFGDDEVDFPIHEWMALFFSNEVAYMESGYPGGDKTLEAIADAGSDFSERLTKPKDAADILNSVSERLMHIVKVGTRLRGRSSNGKGGKDSYTYLPQASDDEPVVSSVPSAFDEEAATSNGTL